MCVVFTIIGIFIIKKEYNEKKKENYKFCEGDLVPKTKDIVVILLISFFAAFATSFCGIGPGSVICPILVIIGISPMVATATGMYIGGLIALSSTIQALLLNQIRLDYSLYINIMTLFGTFPGIFFQKYLIKITGRVSSTVIVLTICLFTGMIASIGINIPKIMYENEKMI